MGTKYSGNNDETRALNTFIKLVRAENAVAERINHTFRENRLTVSQFGVLETLYHLGPLCQREIAGKILKTTGNITMVIDNLTKRGLVQRERDEEDRRFMRVSLTEKGRKLIADIFPGHARTIAEAMSALTSEEQETLSSLLKKLGTNNGNS